MHVDARGSGARRRRGPRPSPAGSPILARQPDEAVAHLVADERLDPVGEVRHQHLGRWHAGRHRLVVLVDELDDAHVGVEREHVAVRLAERRRGPRWNRTGRRSGRRSRPRSRARSCGTSVSLVDVIIRGLMRSRPARRSSARRGQQGRVPGEAPGRRARSTARRSGAAARWRARAGTGTAGHRRPSIPARCRWRARRTVRTRTRSGARRVGGRPARPAVPSSSGSARPRTARRRARSKTTVARRPELPARAEREVLVEDRRRHGRGRGQRLLDERRRQSPIGVDVAERAPSSRPSSSPAASPGRRARSDRRRRRRAGRGGTPSGEPHGRAGGGRPAVAGAARADRRPSPGARSRPASSPEQCLLERRPHRVEAVGRACVGHRATSSLGMLVGSRCRPSRARGPDS